MTRELEKIENVDRDGELTPDDFVTMCNVCNEGLKNEDLTESDLERLTLKEKVKEAPESKKKEILEMLKEEFD